MHPHFLHIFLHCHVQITEGNTARKLLGSLGQQLTTGSYTGFIQLSGITHLKGCGLIHLDSYFQEVLTQIYYRVMQVA